MSKWYGGVDVAVHLSDLWIDTYRGIRNLEIKNLGDVNMITGDNNCGKTSVMELLKNLDNISDIGTWLDDKRNMHDKRLPYDVMENLFCIDKDKKEISYRVKRALDQEVSSFRLEAEKERFKLSKNEMRKLALLPDVFKSTKLEESNYSHQEVSRFSYCIYYNDICEEKGQVYNFPIENRRREKNNEKLAFIKVKYISPVEHIMGNMYLNDVLDNTELYQELLAVLKEFDENIISVNAEMSKNSYNQKVYKILVEGRNKALPIDVYGDGMKKAILLMSAVVIAKNGLLLLDEFETAIHTTEMNQVFSWLLQTCQRLNIQLFLTSHSKEAIDKLLKCVPELQNRIRVITLYKKENKTVARVLDGKEAIETQDELGLELR